MDKVYNIVSNNHNIIVNQARIVEGLTLKLEKLQPFYNSARWIEVSAPSVYSPSTESFEKRCGL